MMQFITMSSIFKFNIFLYDSNDHCFIDDITFYLNFLQIILENK